jgi:hypothetical protein
MDIQGEIMEPLFNLYGNPDEGVATQTEVTDSDIKQAKEANTAALHASIVAHEILSPRDIPDTELMDHCSSIVNLLLSNYNARQDQESKKMISLMSGQPFAFKAKALHKMISEANPTILETIQKLQLQPDSVQNCIAVSYHFEHTPEELGSDGNVFDPQEVDNRPFYQKHPIITLLGVLLVVSILNKR